MHEKYKVTILQDYIPAYRVPLFEEMRKNALNFGIVLRIASGDTNKIQAQRRDNVEGIEDIKVKQIHLKFANRNFTLRNSRKLFKSTDYLIIEQGRRDIFALTLFFKKRNNLGIWGHGKDYVQEKDRISKFILKKMTLQSSWFFGYTPESTKSVIEYGFPVNNTTTLWNSIDTLSLRKNINELHEINILKFRQSFGNKPKIGLFLGSLDKSKRLEFLIEAGDKVYKKIPEFVLLIFGEGPQLQYLKQKANARSWLRIMGRLESSHKALILKASDILLNPGRVGLVAVEALVSNLPVITTNWPFHAPEFFYLNDQNSIITKDSVNDYSSRIIEIFNNPDLLVKKQNGDRSILEKLSIEKMSDTFLNGISNWIEETR